MYAFMIVVIAIVAAMGLALLIGIVMALLEGVGTPRTRNEARRIAANIAKAK
jgi:lipopolysaccharide export LptBFGC system permease protein LptF